MKNNYITLLIDFDSTFVSVESLDVLAEIVLEKIANREKVLEEIKAITNLGMEGKISFPESLSQRMKLFRPSKKDVEQLTEILHSCITPSIKKYQPFFQRHKSSIYIVSSGFREYMVPVSVEFGLGADHIFGNEFLFERNGEFVGFNSENMLAKEKGKVRKIQQEKLDGVLYMIGDGHTDWEVKDAGLAEKFFVFTEHVARESVMKKADIVAKNFDDVLKNL